MLLLVRRLVILHKSSGHVLKFGDKETAVLSETGTLPILYYQVSGTHRRKTDQLHSLYSTDIYRLPPKRDASYSSATDNNTT